MKPDLPNNGNLPPGFTPSEYEKDEEEQGEYSLYDDEPEYCREDYEDA